MTETLPFSQRPLGTFSVECKAQISLRHRRGIGGQPLHHAEGDLVSRPPFAMEEVLFDPQTSGGLLIALPKESAPALEAKLLAAGLPAAIVGTITEKMQEAILVTK